MGRYFHWKQLAEGLDLQGSDHDFRFDINNVYNIWAV